MCFVEAGASWESCKDAGRGRDAQVKRGLSYLRLFTPDGGKQTALLKWK